MQKLTKNIQKQNKVEIEYYWLLVTDRQTEEFHSFSAYKGIMIVRWISCRNILTHKTKPNKVEIECDDDQKN